MDSVTQIILGAAVGEAVLGNKVGNKAMLYGAIAGTIPDLDVLSSQFTDTTRALEIHRGITHSVLFSVVMAPVMAWLVTRYESVKDFRGWTSLFFWAFFTHPLLDAHTTWGTQLFWPLDIRLAFKSIFVIDPLYTLPFLTFLILAMLRKRTNPKRKRYNTIGLAVSSGYLVITLLLKWLAFTAFEDALRSQGVSYTQMETRPTPLNTILWSANVDAGDTYLLGNYSFFDSRPVTFHAHPKEQSLPQNWANTERAKRMVHISKGWYTITRENDTAYFNDLRFGTMSVEPSGTDFVFKYAMYENAQGELEFTEVRKAPRDGKKLLVDLWERIQGN